MPPTVAISTGESGTKPNSVETRPKKGVAMANAVAAIVVQRRRPLGRLRQAGPRVRRTSTTPSSVSSETTNHVVWNVALAPHDRDTLFGGGARGLTDYPALAAKAA